MEFQGTTSLYHQTADITFLDALRKQIADNDFRRVSVCSAFATQKGVTQIRGLMPAGSRFRWIFGLDDAFTEPGALRLAANASNSQLRTAELRSSKLRPLFHPKIYLLDKGTHDVTTIVVGSVNLTNAALTRNCEAFSVTSVVGNANAQRAERYWRKFWQRSSPFDLNNLGAYEVRHKRARKRNQAFPEDTSDHNAREMRTAINNAAQTAGLVWSEIGSMTGFQTEQIDILKDLVPYLGVSPIYQQGDEHFITGVSETGMRQYRLVFYNGMWRLINARQAFITPLTPPDDSRSAYILVFRREGSRYELSIVDKQSVEARRLIDSSRKAGFLQRSAGGRQYGWI